MIFDIDSDNIELLENKWLASAAQRYVDIYRTFMVTIQFPPRVKAGWGHDAGYSDSIN
jgi:hypothetical protein